RRPSRQWRRRVRANEESSHSCIVLLMLGGCLPDFSVACGRVAVLFVSAVGILLKGGNIMLHLIWYIIVGLIAGWAAKSVMHMHLSLMWNIGLGVVGSVVGGLVATIFLRSTT